MNMNDIPPLEGLEHLIGAYLNFDLEEMPNDACVVKHYLTEESREVVNPARADVDQLLALPLTDEELQEVLDRRLRSRVFIQGFGLTPREWLERLRDWLTHGVPDAALDVRSNALAHASTFADIAQAELAVAEAIDAHQDEITEWLQRRERRFRIDHNLSRSVGTLICWKREDELHPTSVRVICLRDPDFEPSGWRILTSYPIERMSRTEVRQRFPHLDVLFGDYFTQDWHDSHGHPRFVVETFVQENPPDFVRAALRELPTLREIPKEDAELGELLIYDLGAEYAAPRLGKTYRQFLMEIEAFLGKSLSP